MPQLIMKFIMFMDNNNQKNVLGEKLEICSSNPVTGWFRDGCCNTNEIDATIISDKVVDIYFETLGE